MTAVEQTWAAAWRAVPECRPTNLADGLPCQSGDLPGHDDDLALAAALRWLVERPNPPDEQTCLVIQHDDEDDVYYIEGAGEFPTLDAAVAAAVVAAGKERT